MTSADVIAADAPSVDRDRGGVGVIAFSLSVLWMMAGLLAVDSPVDARPAAVTGLDPNWLHALQYYKRVNVQYSCLEPQPRVIAVQRVHPDAGVSYVTTCVVLHRCAADVGCCAETDTCVVRQPETVQIPIITHDAREPYRLLTFTNHTSCHCVPKRQLRIREEDDDDDDEDDQLM